MTRFVFSSFAALVLLSACASGGAKTSLRRSASDASVPITDAYRPPAIDAAVLRLDASRTDAYVGQPDPTGTGGACSSGHIGRRIHLETRSNIGACDSAWTIVLWGAGGRFEEYRSLPGHPLDVDILDDWHGYAAATAYCGSWDGVRHWETMTLPALSAAGLYLTVDGIDMSDEVLVCYDPGGGLYRPLVPIDCGLDPCPGPTY